MMFSKQNHTWPLMEWIHCISSDYFNKLFEHTNFHINVYEVASGWHKFQSETLLKIQKICGLSLEEAAC